MNNNKNCSANKYFIQKFPKTNKFPESQNSAPYLPARSTAILFRKNFLFVIYLRLFRNARSAAPPARSPDTAPAIGVASPVFTALFGVPADGFCVED